MINLLPPELKQSYRYAHANVRLVRWVTLSIIALVGLAVISVGGILFLQHSTDNYRTQAAATQDYLKAHHQKDTQKKVTDMSNNLKLVTQVLSREVLFSKLLTRLGSVMPSNVILDNLSITQTTGAINISAKATDYQAATQVQVNLADPANRIFSKADIVSINCEGDANNPKYPCRVIIKALFADNNPFLFINNGKDATQ
jgi:capsular polysaccharide biosynthesis protein